jgi:hypothetical protein
MPDSSIRRTLPVMEAPTKASVTISKSFDANGVGRQTPTRGVLFLSHATPEENTFAAWLAAQLVSAGYEVWCDLTKLLGGERFWRNIDEAIDRHTFRFLFVSTLLAHQKPGAQRELNLALKAQERLGLTDFVIPLKIDAFPFGSMDARLRDLNIMRFDEGWHAARNHPRLTRPTCRLGMHARSSRSGKSKSVTNPSTRIGFGFSSRRLCGCTA